MLPVEIIQKKRDGLELSQKEITEFISLLVNGKVSEAQAAAFLMSAYIKGLNSIEIAYLTYAMSETGKKFNFRDINKPVIDKHSTGGVGDKVSLLLTPMAAACGLAVPMISGRGLGHTGGTADKLESIIGYKVQLNEEEMRTCLNENGCFIITQDDDVAPADRILYSIRDVTATVDNFGLITASIMSKKITEGLDGLVIDLKVGRGAFMANINDAKKLGESMMSLANEINLPLRIVFSAMDEPLGKSVGNWLEVMEAEEGLIGNCPSDLRLLTERLVASMLVVAKLEDNIVESQNKIKNIWDNKIGLLYFNKMIELQGGNLEKSKNHYKNTPKKEIVSYTNGYITSIDSKEIGIASIILGSGRLTQKDELDYSAGIVFNKKIGDYIQKDELLATVYGKNSDVFDYALYRIKNAIKIIDEIVEKPTIILDEWY